MQHVVLMPVFRGLYLHTSHLASHVSGGLPVIHYH